MPSENNPNPSRIEQQPETPKWIGDWEASISLQLGNKEHLTYEQLQEKKVLNLTQTAVGAASSPYISGHVENNTFVNTPPEAAALEPITVEVLHYTQLPEKELSARIEGFRQDLLEGKTQDDFRLAA